MEISTRWSSKFPENDKPVKIWKKITEIEFKIFKYFSVLPNSSVNDFPDCSSPVMIVNSESVVESYGRRSFFWVGLKSTNSLQNFSKQLE